MHDSAFFATFDPLFCEAPDTCEVCGVNLPIFQYECCTQTQGKEHQYAKGFCCASCAVRLLQHIKILEAREWAEEETALRADDMDVTEFHKRRLAAFSEAAAAVPDAVVSEPASARR